MADTWTATEAMADAATKQAAKALVEIAKAASNPPAPSSMNASTNNVAQI